MEDKVAVDKVDLQVEVHNLLVLVVQGHMVVVKDKVARGIQEQVLDTLQKDCALVEHQKDMQDIDLVQWKEHSHFEHSQMVHMVVEHPHYMQGQS